MKIHENGEVAVDYNDICETPEQFWASKDVARIIAIINAKTQLNYSLGELKTRGAAFRAAREVFEQMPLRGRMKEFGKIKSLLDKVQAEVDQKGSM